MTESNRCNRYCFPQLSQPGAPPSGTAPPPSPDQLLQAAESEGYAEGFAQGKKHAFAVEQGKFDPLRAVLQSIRRTLDDRQIRIGHCAEQDAAHLSVVAARQLIRKEISRRPELTANIARRALQLVKGMENLRIKAHPADGAIIGELLAEMSPGKRPAESVQIIADPTIQQGGCQIESDFGTIDARIDKQLGAMIDSLGTLYVNRGCSQAGDGPRLPDFDSLRKKIDTIATIKAAGHVSKVVGLVVEANGPAVQLGCICDIDGTDGEAPVSAEILGFRDHTVLMMPLEDIRTIGPGSRVVARQEKASVVVGNKLLGRIIDGLGRPIDGLGALAAEERYPIYAPPINPLLRQRIREPLDMGVRAINGLLSVGCGQRMGIFAGSGVGKSVLMGMIARKSRADVNVIALIGERGRELNEFIDKDLGPEGLKKSVVVVATSDHLPLVRVRGAFVATAIAEFFRDQGLRVNLMMDSLTRFAMAQREIGLALGEPPTTKGYTPSVFTLLPKLLERAGTSDHNGSITGLYTVLVEGDDMNEPIADAARSILDGHIVLSRELADHNHYPAIDVLRSISRVMEDIASLQHKHNAGQLKELLATYRKAEDLINIGAYVAGANRGIDLAIAKFDLINRYLRQGIDESMDFETCLLELDRIMNAA
jgi:flagellum-specific ATP synthase